MGKLALFFNTFFKRAADMDAVEREWYGRLESKGQENICRAFREGRREIAALPHTELDAVNRGTSLHARLYAPEGHRALFILVHGFHSFGEHDFAPVIPRLYEMGIAALVIDQRCHGKSGGKYITYGAREHEDMLCWCRLMAERGEKNVYLWGVSMGCATVLMAAGESESRGLIKGVVADCGYSSMRHEFTQSMARHKMGGAYPFIRFACRLVCGFDPDRIEVGRYVKNITVPVLFVHGEQDGLVPIEHAKANFDACGGEKSFFSVPGAGHGLSFAADPEGYLRRVRELIK